ncbi:MAG: hypothetical protein NXI10_05005 [bacterium]|nr:hypothetical protein [bacterium]
MKEIYERITEAARRSAKERGTFVIPLIEGYEKIELDYSTGGATLYGKRTQIIQDNEEINITFECKDKCKTFQVKPDLNIINIVWTKNGEIIERFSDSWEDKM